MKISSKQVLEYYNEHGIEDYPKTKTGLPHMGRIQNIKTANKIMKQLIMDKNLDENYDNYTVSNDKNYREEITNLTDEQIKYLQKMNTHCVICAESLNKNYCRLDCEHEFCLSCIMKHSRNTNTCPLCRSEFCEKPKKIESISDTLIREILNVEAHENADYENFNDSENLRSFMESFENEIEDFAHIVAKTTCGEFTPDDYSTYVDEMKKVMLKNVNDLTISVAERVADYYDDQT